MASSTPNTILLKRNCAGGDPEMIEAAVHTAAVKPGDLLLHTANGVTGNTTAADVDAHIMFAIENPYIDPRVVATAAIDTDYAIGAVARCIIPERGDLVYARLVAGGNVAKGAALEASATAGVLQAYTSGRIVGFADEAKNNSGGGSPVRIKVRVA